MAQVAVMNVDGSVNKIDRDSKESLDALRQLSALMLKAALQKEFAGIRLGADVAEEDGFYVDSDKDEQQVSADELPQLEAAIKAIAKSEAKVEFKELSVEEALASVKDDPFSTELINENAKDGKVAMYDLDGVLAVANAPVLVYANLVKNYKLLSVAGAYWKGMSSNPMLQRIYGTAFYKKDDLEADLKARQEAKERDHRVIGNQLDLFFVDPKVGAGLPYWMPKGATIRRTIERYIIDKELADGYEHVYTPVLMNLDAYKTSGHWAHYREDMFPPMDMGDGEMLELRPMNCPSHIQVYKHHIRSYRELPLRIAELGMMHRYEKSGALSGLQRVREMTLNDGHTFVALEQIQDEFAKILKLIMDVYKDFDITDYTFRLSYRDPKNTEKYFANDEMWERSQSMLKAAMDSLGLDYYEAEGEAAFYGPKLDIQTKTALGNEETMSTIQLDFMLPEKFDLHYVGEDGKQHRPVMIHRGVVGTMERFVAYLTEIYKGAFPTWLSPEQVVIIPVSDEKHGAYADELAKKFKAAQIRAKVDHRNEKMGYKIREAQTQKVPYTLVVGEDEMANDSVSVRKYGEKDQNGMTVDAFMDEILHDIATYSRED
ncbi:threonine--tRNA ligase [Limosilactobacillus mucosae]|jgi:threonyl-tRNA synthetase|uniref:Threonine--tRNA ligase n=2 Tax=Limosilactobacillus mucosae TaxID=97478 RepID=A0A0R1P964_LIMMU|nr:threonine--tRNA ligase [Limosilactobacillus mucosae]KRL25331.1 threonyl-tRNA synthetase [Limosilactobacillus mucosae DSM 13345]MCF0119219.1 threonine--tRNA ligase [Limosilactobacillus mucosae]MDE8676842.1 threonine--tRNA ligase [Limosilactobacillus mucosae]QOL70251.1 threonine--tRNA ligase [Limosilactobacillus mucosae]RXA58557.1 threonine--tRNA ligase [Limosilactobacillus mucosae]